MYIPSKFNKIQYQLRDNNKRKIYALQRVGINSLTFSFGDENYYYTSSGRYFDIYPNQGTLDTNPPTIYIWLNPNQPAEYFQIENGATISMTGNVAHIRDEGCEVYLNIYINDRFYNKIQFTDNIGYYNPARFTLPLINKNQAYYFQCCVIE